MALGNDEPIIHSFIITQRTTCHRWQGRSRFWGHFPPPQFRQWHFILRLPPWLQFPMWKIKSCGASIGWLGNPSKTRILPSYNRSSILPKLTHHNPSLAISLTKTFAQFSTTPYPTNKTAPGHTAVFRLPGDPVASPMFASKIFNSYIADVKKHITSILDNIID